MKSPFLCLFLFTTIISHGVTAQPSAIHYIQVADSKVYVEERGKGEALILLHAGNMDHRMWKPQQAAFSRHYRVITIDLRGCGYTQDGDSTYLQSLAIAAVMDSLHIQKASLIGVSLGAVAATEFALDYPERVHRLVLVSPGITGIDLNHDSTLVKYYRQMNTAWTRHDTTAYINLFINAWVDGPFRNPSDMNQAVRKEALTMASDNIRKRREGVHLGFTFEPDQLHRLDSLQAPVFVVTGDQDMCDIKIIASEYKKHGAETVVIKDVAHMVTMEKPKEFNHAALFFLQKN